MIGKDVRVPLHHGGIVYITDYIMIQCTEEGVYDVWLRTDTSHLGVTKEEVEALKE